MSFEARILDSLRPIFPQLNDHVLTECIRKVQETVGSDPATIVPGCVDLLLSGTINEENFTPNRSVPPVAKPTNEKPNSLVIEEDEDVVYISTTSRVQTTAATRLAPVIIDNIEITAYHSSSTPRGASTLFPLKVASKTEDLRRNLPFEGETRVPCAPFSHMSSANLQDSSRHIQSGHAQTPLEPSEAMKNLYSLFPDVRDDHLQSLLNKWSHFPQDVAINYACNDLLENRDYPKKSSKLNSPSGTNTPGNDCVEKDFFKDFSSPVSLKYQNECLCLLQNEFRRIPKKHIRKALQLFQYHYAPSRRYLQEQLQISTDGGATATVTACQRSSAVPSAAVDKTSNVLSHQPPKIQLLRCRHSTVPLDYSHMDEELLREMEFVKKCDLSKTAEEDQLFALSLNDQQYEEEGQKIECGCCYGDAAFEDMVQCLDGHLFCASCLMNYAKEAAFGQGKTTLACMSDGCEGTFPMSQLKKALPIKILEKYEDRVQEESLSLAQMDDFVRCPFCDFAAILPLEEKVFKCQNPSCAKETCRYCKEEWSDHFGLKCNEVEKSAQKDVRLSYEERMTMAKIRKCPKCGCEFTKSDGCNKMTCRCGATMCYVCRKPNIHYNHFCQHPKDPGKQCTNCKSCLLWSDPSEDDNHAVKELEKEAQEAKRKFEAESEDNPAKRVKNG
ncbi:E3 ubiquitin-protein ligase RNF216-like [Stylophora pistillata]|nr:E3 ubiquitin-protein ligase RNF216-like [Stylophora pistillata]